MAPAGPTPRAPDGGWGWVVVACSFLALLLGNGPPQAVGILYPEWLLAFGEGKGTTAWVVSLVGGIGSIVGPLCSMCVVNFGARQTVIFGGVMVSGGLMLSAFAPNVHFLIFSYGIMLGVGIGLLYTAICTIICVYFDKRRGLALGMISTGSSVGGFLYAILQSKLIQHYGLEGCLLIIGALALNVVACAGTMRPLTPSRSSLKQRAILEQEAEEQHLQDKEEDPSVKDTTGLPARSQTLFDCWTFVKIIKMKTGHFLQGLSSVLSTLQNRVFTALCMSHFLYCLGNSPAEILLEDLARSYKLSDGVATISLVSCYSIGGGVGKLAIGSIADILCMDRVFLYALMVATSGLTVLLIPLSSSYWNLQMVSLVLGFMSGNWALVTYITSRLVGVEKFPEAYGILLFFGRFGLMLGPPVVGCFHDFAQSYGMAFYLGGSSMIASSFALSFIAILCRRQTPFPLPPPPETEVISCTVTTATDATSPQCDQ